MFVSSVFLTLVLLKCCEGYRLGPPLSACGNMTPTGHPYDAQDIQSPFTFTLNATTFRPGDVVEVFLNSSGEWFMEGVLIQARSTGGAAVGTFSIMDNDVFLKTFDCFDTKASALRHYAHLHIYNRTFYWNAPCQSVGAVYLRATIARNQSHFWEDVRSETITDEGDGDNTCGATNPAFTAAILVITVIAANILS